MALVAAWRHRDAREGFETVWVTDLTGGGRRLDGAATGVEDGVAWAVEYAIELDAAWRTRVARVSSRWAEGTHAVRLEADGAGRWRLDGAPAAHLDGCLDVDLEASACTNAFPVNRLCLAAGEQADAPAAYVRAPALEVERLEQSYTRLPGEARRFDYDAPRFDARFVLPFDATGFVVEYPGLAIRVL